MTTARQPKVLLIGGWGRSGSTLLNDMVGSVEGAFGAGELRGIFAEMAPASVQSTCSCGRPHAECPFWTAVFTEAFGGPDRIELDRLARFDAGRLRMRPRELLALTRALRAGGPGDAQRHADHLSRLYAAIARVAGARLVVDSSKAPPYLWLVAALADVRPYVLQLVRDPRGAAFSWRRRSIYGWEAGPAKSSAYWLASNAILEGALRRPGRVPYRVLRYEDFMARPRAVVEDLLDWLGEDSDGVRWADDRTVVLRRQHTMGGNPSRFVSGEVSLRLDDEWRRRMTSRDRAAATLPALPLLRRYGYPVRV